MFVRILNRIFLCFIRKYIWKKFIFFFYLMNGIIYEEYFRKVKVNVYILFYNINMKLVYLFVNCFLLI